ncbi:MAG TPA: hypothetical protein ENN05_08450 [Deltaproteobacteria bacterium]|nr:hypothetical protein [Deltaproteobacteria bacterium]
MTYEVKGSTYMEPQDLKVKLLDFLPRVPVEDNIVSSELGRDFLGPDEVVALIQVAVARSVDYQSDLKDELLKIHSSGKSIKDTVFKKNLSGIGRGHSLDGLPVIALGINGTKMIDSALTGVVYSRSLVTSGRRREAKSLELVVPRSISAESDLFEEYREISQDLFEFAQQTKTRFAKKIDAIQAMNKLKPYNDPADLFYVLPLSSLVNLSTEVQEQKHGNIQYLPEECALFIDAIEEMIDEMGMGQIYRMRKAVPRETYLHYSIFREPGRSDYAALKHEEYGNPIDPKVVGMLNDLPDAARKELKEIRALFDSCREYTDSQNLYDITCRNRQVLSSFCRRYNEALRIKTISSLSWRVWSEQKRHGTLAQHVESIYSAADRAYTLVREIWPVIEKRGDIDRILSQASNAFVISEELVKEKEILQGYLYHTARQIMFYGKLIERNILKRDALYCVPRNIRLRTLESYDLINAASLELPLRLCTECEPERRITSEKKAKSLKKHLPDLAFLLEPKCCLGYCTEGKFCANIIRSNPRYTMDVHTEIADIISRTAAER